MKCIYDKGAFKSFGFLCWDKVCALQRTLKEVLSDIKPEDICLFYNVTVKKKRIQSRVNDSSQNVIQNRGYQKIALS